MLLCSYAPLEEDKMYKPLREVSNGELSGMDMYLMPGFKLSWYYSGMEFTPEPLMEFPIFSKNYEISKYNIDFVRKVSYYLIYDQFF